LQAVGCGILLSDDNRRADIAEYPGIQRLLITARSRKWQEDRGATNICQLGDGSRTGSSDDEIGRGVDIGQFITQELDNMVAVTNSFRKRFSNLQEIPSIRVCARRTSLVNDLRPIEDAREQRGDALVDRTGASRSACDIDNRHSGLEPKALQTAWAVAGCQAGTNRIAS
jgi:hypothetical protein